MPLYREQYERMKRWYTRFAKVDMGREHDAASDFYIDEIYAFFLNCYHLKDWINNDGTVAPAVKQATESFINGNRPLTLCADICNSLKHLHLSRPSRSGENPSFGRKHFALVFGEGSSTRISMKYEIETDSGLEDAFELARLCVDAWDLFFSTHNL